MQAAAARAEIIVRIRDRVNAQVAGRMSERDALQVSIAAAMRDNEEVLGFLLPHHLIKGAIQSSYKYKILPDEWSVLFGNGAQAIRDGGVQSVVISQEFRPHLLKLTDALRTTITEKDQAVVWSRSWTKLLAYLSMHMDEANDALVGVLGTVIKADERRIEEFHNQVDDDGPEVLLVAKVIIAVSSCVL